MKALEILKEVSLNNKWIEENGFFFGDRKIKEAIQELEALEYKDRLAELEKVILDYYLSIGYKVGIGGWGFYVVIESDYKSKQLVVYFRTDSGSNYEQILKTIAVTTREMFDKAIRHFK